MTISRFPQDHRAQGSFTVRLRRNDSDSEVAELELWKLAYGVCRWLGARYVGLSEPCMHFSVGGTRHIFSFEQCDELNALYAESEGAGPASDWAAEFELVGERYQLVQWAAREHLVAEPFLYKMGDILYDRVRKDLQRKDRIPI